MATSNINIRVDSDLKREAEALFDDLGLNMSTAITMFLRSAVSHDGLPFEVKRKGFNTETRTALAEYKEMKKNDGGYKRYHSFDELAEEVLGDA
ncbi:MAG: type II toxin-antitoxin system RelB/DinJ family antitoxin [Clostridia bacterium]|nr:type II toxin-antitoxin system RelB/DinJ family antitoxin [Clostridia bacterium]